MILRQNLLHTKNIYYNYAINIWGINEPIKYRYVTLSSTLSKIVKVFLIIDWYVNLSQLYYNFNEVSVVLCMEKTAAHYQFIFEKKHKQY